MYGVGWIKVFQGEVQWWALENRVMDLLVPQKAENVLIR
jgi:hypothetical protein